MSADPRLDRLLRDANTRLPFIDPGRDDPGLTDAKAVLGWLLEAVEILAEGRGARFRAKVISSGMVTLPAELRAAKGIVAGQQVTLDLVAVEDVPAVPAQG